MLEEQIKKEGNLSNVYGGDHNEEKKYNLYSPSGIGYSICT